MEERPDDTAIEHARAVLTGAQGQVDEKTVDAARTMARAFPDEYTTQLVEQLLRHQDHFRDDAELQLPLLDEALESARRLEPPEPAWPGLVARVIFMRARWLQEHRKWAEAMDTFAELDRYRGLEEEAEHFLKHHWGLSTGLNLWATALAESGRHAEAVEIWSAELNRPRPTGTGMDSPTVIGLADALETLGRFDEAVAAISTISVLTQRRFRASLFALVHLARVHQAAGDREARLATLDEAAAFLSRLADVGEEPAFRGFQKFDLPVFLACSTRVDEPARTDGEPGYAYGASFWSPVLRNRFHAEAEGLLAEAGALKHGAERVILHRRATVRLASFNLEFVRRGYERLAEPFDEGVVLAEEAVRLDSAASELLVRALTDRAQYRAACGDFEGARADFSAALDLIKAA